MADLGGTFNSEEYKQALFPEGEHAVQIIESDLTQRKNGAEDLNEKKLMLTIAHKDGWARIKKVDQFVPAAAGADTATSGGEKKKPW
jgi:hypothetical protein